jgi:hypothetical protein
MFVSQESLIADRRRLSAYRFARGIGRRELPWVKTGVTESWHRPKGLFRRVSSSGMTGSDNQLESQDLPVAAPLKSHSRHDFAH